MSSKFIFETEARTKIHREGIDELLDYIAHTDFYEAPASTKYHGAEEGGLVRHSLEVYRWIYELRDFITEHGFITLAPVLNDESLAIVSLFHDLCKVNTYTIDYRNAKNEETGIWEKVPYYRYNDISGFGAHAAKSLYPITRCMRLTESEYIAILHHMGAYEQTTYNKPSEAYSYHPLAWLLHAADEAATFISKT